MRNAITLTDLHNELRGAYGGRVHIEHIRRVANWSGLCDQAHCLRKVDRITHWRYFRFSSDDGKLFMKGSTTATICHVKRNCVDPWVPLFSPSSRATKTGFLVTVPNISHTPYLNIPCPDGLREVTKRLDTEEGRVKNIQKMIELHALRDFVFQSRTDRFHWDMSNSVELEHISGDDLAALGMNADRTNDDTDHENDDANHENDDANHESYEI